MVHPPATRPALLSTALDAAAAAARVHEDAREGGGAAWTESKTTSSDFVSDVDVAAQEAALGIIRTRHPDHAILAEEDEPTGPKAPPSQPRAGGGLTWIVDPLDGTTNYLHGHPFYAASVAVWDDQGPVVGVVHASALNTVWHAVRGEGAWEQNRPIRVSSVEDMAGALIGTGFPFKALHAMGRYLSQLGRVLEGTAGVRRAGAAAIDLAYVANGTLDAFWELHLHPWDYGAGALLVQEAGGVVERLEGGRLTEVAGTVLAANSPSSARALRRIAQADAPELD